MQSIVPKIVVHVHNRIAKVRILFSNITIHIYIIINNIPQNFFSPVKRKNYAIQNPW